MDQAGVCGGQATIQLGKKAQAQGRAQMATQEQAGRGKAQAESRPVGQRTSPAPGGQRATEARAGELTSSEAGSTSAAQARAGGPAQSMPSTERTRAGPAHGSPEAGTGKEAGEAAAKTPQAGSPASSAAAVA
jgi:hypothetical protein